MLLQYKPFMGVTNFERQLVVRLLKDELDYRRRSNASYSLRAFARDLDISPSRLSEIFNGKSYPSKPKTRKLLDAMGIGDSDLRAYRSSSLVEENSRTTLSRNYQNSNKEFHFVEQDIYRVISEWRHFAVLTCMRLDQFGGTTIWLSRRLGLSLDLVIDSIERLKKLSLISEQDGKLKAIKDDIETENDIPSRALKISHQSAI